jgi:hypothetical protein
MNQWNYNEIYMQEQNHPAWQGNQMRPSTATLGQKGCFMDCLRYAKSKLENKMLGLAEANEAMSVARGYTLGGEAIHAKVLEVLKLRISLSKPWFTNRVVTMRNVWVRGKNNVTYSHWITELSGGLMFDPLMAGGQFVHKIDFYVPVLLAGGALNRRFITLA